MSNVTITRNGEPTGYDKMIKTADKLAELAGTEELSDKDVDDLVELLDGEKDPIQDMPSNNGVLINENGDPSENKMETVCAQRNPATGLLMTIPYESNKELTEEDVDNIINLKEEDMTKVELNNENVESFISAYNMSEEEVNRFISVLNRYRAHEKMQYYKEMPAAIKKEIDDYVSIGCATHNADKTTLNAFRNEAAKEILDSVIFDNYQKKAFLDIAAFTNQQIDKESEKLTEDLSAFNSAHRKKYEHDFLEEADRIEKEEEDTEENRETIGKLRAVSHNFIQAYTYEEMYEAYKSGKIRVKPIMIDKFKRTCSDFNQKYYNSTFTIRDIGLTIEVLDKLLPKHYDLKVLQKFIAAFTVYTRNYKPSDVAQHVFMYFFITNILTLGIDLPDEESSKFNNDLKETICEFLDLIIEKDEEKKNNTRKK